MIIATSSMKYQFLVLHLISKGYAYQVAQLVQTQIPQYKNEDQTHQSHYQSALSASFSLSLSDYYYNALDYSSLAVITKSITPLKLLPDDVLCNANSVSTQFLNEAINY